MGAVQEFFEGLPTRVTPDRIEGMNNPTTAYMTGKLKIKGDMGAAMKLQKIF
jgi:putative sterol carrier protein